MDKVLVDGEMIHRRLETDPGLLDRIRSIYPDHELVICDEVGTPKYDLIFEGPAAEDKFRDMIVRMKQNRGVPKYTIKQAVDADYGNLEQRYAHLYEHQREAIRQVQDMPRWTSIRFPEAAQPMPWLHEFSEVDERVFATLDSLKSPLQIRPLITGGRRMGRTHMRDILKKFDFEYPAVSYTVNPYADAYRFHRDKGKTHAEAVRILLAPVKKRRKVYARLLEGTGAEYEAAKKKNDE